VNNMSHSPLSLDTQDPAISAYPPGASTLAGGGKALLTRSVAWKHARWGIIWLLAGLSLVPFTQDTSVVIYRFLEGMNADGLFNTARQFPTFWGFLTVSLLILMLDFAKVRFLPYLFVAVAIGGVSNELIKQGAGRMRPEYSVLSKQRERDEVKAFLAKYPHVPLKIEKVDQWLFLKTDRPRFVDMFGSFPSGHANSAFVLAAFLPVLYPRVRWIILAYAVACALSRIQGRRHFLEDVCVGGAMGWMLAHWVWTWVWPSKLGLLLERSLARLRWFQSPISGSGEAR
jgi:membrane-associated phospholipid phosphatase